MPSQASRPEASPLRTLAIPEINSSPSMTFQTDDALVKTEFSLMLRSSVARSQVSEERNSVSQKGNLYGTTIVGGNVNLPRCYNDFSGNGCGVVFKLDPNGTETVIYAFTGGTDGGGPNSDLIRDAAGNLYGTTLWGGTGKCVIYAQNFPGCGVVFKITP